MQSKAGSESLHFEQVGPRAGPQQAIAMSPSRCRTPLPPARQVENQNQARTQRAEPPITAMQWVRARHRPHQADNWKLSQQQTLRRDSGRVPPQQNLSRAGSGGCGRICCRCVRGNALPGCCWQRPKPAGKPSQWCVVTEGIVFVFAWGQPFGTGETK